MPHIDGHIQDSPESVGILSPSIAKEKGLFFIPPSFKTKAGDEVGFHLLEIPTEGGPILIAYDLEERKKKNGKSTSGTDEDEEKDDKMYMKTREYAKFYDHGKKSPTAVIKSVLHRLKTVDQLREIKKSCEFISDRLRKREDEKQKR